MLEAPRRAPGLARAHPRWRSTLASTCYGFKALSNTDRVPVCNMARGLESCVMEALGGSGGPKVWGSGGPDGLFASDLPGPPRSPAGGLFAPERPRLPASARLPPGLTQFRV